MIDSFFCKVTREKGWDIDVYYTCWETRLKLHFCCGAETVSLPWKLHSSTRTGSGSIVACRHSCLSILCLSSWCDVYSKYYKDKITQKKQCGSVYGGHVFMFMSGQIQC